MNGRDPVLHIDLRNWADMILISPLDANTLSKLANGQCDNLVVTWDPKKPVILCPAMNTYMWDHPFTERHISFLKKELGYLFLDPITKQLACGDYGIGAMADVKDIVAFVKRVKEEFNIK
ncbi:hypothetical protein HK099_005787 [Clydaea vesicula]|uniref:Flavoprotein domain-containing protein n=1 Tax=Clydaea vesicula TaxID=447962 RepID=A0AAD5TZU4_9FUNG|nr:hypothetical protein HK099_005787 [Clydaea vesicula]